MTDPRGIGTRIAEARAAAGLSGTALGVVVGLKKDQISKIESGTRKVDIAEVVLIAEALGISVNSLLGREERPRLALAARLAAGTSGLEITPVKNRARQILEMDDLLNKVAEMDTSKPSSQGKRTIGELRQISRSVPRSLDEAQSQGRKGAGIVRSNLNQGIAALANLPSLIEQHFGVHVALAPWGEQVDGLCIHSGDVALLMASTDFPQGHVNFTLSYELAHHLFGDPREVIDENSEDMYSSDFVEARANAFAAHFLIPEEGLISNLTYLGEKRGDLGGRSAIILMETFGVSLAALVYHLNTIKWMDFAHGQHLRSQGVANLLAQNSDAAPNDAWTKATRHRRAPERMVRAAFTAARNERLGLSVLALLLEREDDERLWNEVFPTPVSL